jgi:hypothetical protein
MDFSASFGLTPRFSVSVSLPLLIAERTRPGQLDRLRGIPNAPDQVSHSRGIGDVALTGRVWLSRPPPEERQNISIGFGIKLPTGATGTKSTVQTATGPVTRVNDQSIQPGDGGTGFILETQAFKGLGKTTLFFSGTYLLNPRNTNGVLTGRGRPSEAVMSVADQYLARGGVLLAAPKLPRLGISFAGRIEGVPAKDLLGKSDGFRRPGYAISVEPGLIYFNGRDIWSVNVPVAVRRNRVRSVADKRDGTHGDAAFADYFITVGYARRF